MRIKTTNLKFYYKNIKFQTSLWLNPIFTFEKDSGLKNYFIF